MSYYRAGDVIRLSRMACGMTQEGLSENICSTETLSRIENGKCGIKKETYEELMARMHRTPDKAYAISSGMEVEVMEEQVELEDALRRQDYEKASFYLKKIETRMGDSILSRQYIEKKRVIIAYCLKKIDKNEFVEKLEEVIQLTIPDYRNYLEKTYPFTKQEMNTLMSLAIAYKEIDKTAFGIQILEMLLRSLERRYIDSECTIELRISINCNRAKMYGELDNPDKAIAILTESLNDSMINGYEVHIVNILAQIAWNLIEQNKDGIREEKAICLAKSNLIHAYQIACATQDLVMKEKIQTYYHEIFKAQICPEMDIRYLER